MACMALEKVPKEWQRGIIKFIYKGKGETGECKYYRGRSWLNIHGRVYGRAFIEKMREIMERVFER